MLPLTAAESLLPDRVKCSQQRLFMGECVRFACLDPLESAYLHAEFGYFEPKRGVRHLLFDAFLVFSR